MPFRGPELHVLDTLEAVALVESFIGAISLDEYKRDPKTKSAVERQLQIITEAAYRLTPEAEALCPEPAWAAYRGMGNILRHSYHRVKDEVVWETVKSDLPDLKKAVMRALEHHFPRD